MRKVLVVEDEPLIRLAAIDALEDAGFVVIEAANADVAIDIIAAATIQVLFTDIQMPGHLSGVDLAHQVSTLPGRWYCRLGSADFSGHRSARKAQFVSKPYVFDDIAKRLEALGP